MDPIIEVKQLGKRYTIDHGRGGYITLRDVLMNVLRRPFSFLRSKAKQMIGLEKREEFWALKDVSFTVERGEIIGVIGRNGAGKSTLLKILTGITPPTEGEAILRGKVSSLLEVGTGFHPELSGRENIFLNGAILGMSRKDMQRNFDEIVAFAGIERFLDTPVKHYSSGMYVRLAFSVAAHLEPDILLVDEVLAVGDIEFQKKCLGKMEEVTHTAGRTILFVSHNLSAIENLCKRSILLKDGKVAMIDETSKVIAAYQEANLANVSETWEGATSDPEITITRTYAKSLGASGDFNVVDPVEIGIEGVVHTPLRNFILGFTLYSEFGNELAYTLYDDGETTPPAEMPVGAFKKRFVIPSSTLAEGLYTIEFDVGVHMEKRFAKNECDINFTMKNVGGPGSRFPLPPRLKGRSSVFRPLWAKKK